MSASGPEDRLVVLRDAAGQVGADGLAMEAEELHGRLSEGRFYLACVGQFKRGKSSLLNALVGQPVLPVGVTPVTAVITVVRFGERVHARVRLNSGERQDVDPAAIHEFVSERENPDNVKGVAVVEVFVPSALLRYGMCLVDTPGIGSVFAGNTETTLDFVPHIDAALVVLGADPPLSGDELELVEQTGSLIDRLVFVLNKADRLTDEERAEGRSFAEDVLRRRLGRDVGPILEVSATERVKVGPTRDWAQLEAILGRLARGSADVVLQAEDRGVRRLATKLLREIDEQRDALTRPQEESVRRVAALRKTVAEAERTLTELDYLFTAVQDTLAREFERERERFLEEAAPMATQALDTAIEAGADAKDVATHGMESAQVIARRDVENWRGQMVPVAGRLYERAVARFVEIANGFLERVADSTDPTVTGLPRSFEPSLAFRTKARFCFTDMLTIATPKLSTRLAGITRAGRIAAVKKDARAYIVRLLTTNSARVANDFSDQVLESRRRVQAELRDDIRMVVRSAEAAVERAAKRRAEGEDAVRRELEKYERLRADVIRTTATG